MALAQPHTLARIANSEKAKLWRSCMHRCTGLSGACLRPAFGSRRLVLNDCRLCIARLAPGDRDLDAQPTKAAQVGRAQVFQQARTSSAPLRPPPSRVSLLAPEGAGARSSARSRRRAHFGSALVQSAPFFRARSCVGLLGDGAEGGQQSLKALDLAHPLHERADEL